MFRFEFKLVSLIVNHSLKAAQQQNLISVSRSSLFLYKKRQFQTSLNFSSSTKLFNSSKINQVLEKQTKKVTKTKSLIRLDDNQKAESKRSINASQDKNVQLKEKKTKIKKETSDKQESNKETKLKRTKIDENKQIYKIDEILLQKDTDQDDVKFSFKNQVVTVYTDGACSSNGQNEASAGIGVYFGCNHPLNLSKKLEGIQTNNRAEITAAIEAIKIAIEHQAGELILHTDSKYLITCMTSWLRKWKSNGWKTTNNKLVKNINDLKKLDDLCQKIKIKWKYVAGHSGVKGNEEADILAKSAIYK